ncbi:MULTISPECIES: GtrA family protein [unclassified Amycolatopsis]|uniref:GtrA family protein n=2 Tax=Pseudonocardiaceae TaxID=2070 RepID=UPI0018FEC4DB
MTTTRWKPRGRIGLRPRRKASDDPVRDDAQPEFRTLDETPSHRSPDFDEAADQHRAAANDLAALADEIDTRRDLLDSAADRHGENTRRPSAANPRADRQATTDRDADQLPAKPGDNSPRRLPTNSSSDRRKTATDCAEQPRRESSDKPSRHSTAKPTHAPSDTDLLPQQPANYSAAEARQPRAATDPAAEPSHHQPHLTPAAAPIKHPAPPSVADNRPNPEDRTTRRREMGSHAAWYLAAGVVTTGLQAVLFLAFRPEIGAQWANLAALAITTVGNTEFHRRVTFANRSSRAGKRHLQDLVTFAFYAGYGSVVLAALDAVVPHPSAGQQTAVLLAASFVGGVVRFAVLRWWVFARARRADAAQDHQR